MKGKDYEYSVCKRHYKCTLRGEEEKREDSKKERCKKRRKLWIQDVATIRRWRVAKLYLYSLWRAVKIIESPGQHRKTSGRTSPETGMKNETRRGKKGTSDHVWVEGKKKNRTVIVSSTMVFELIARIELRIQLASQEHGGRMKRGTDDVVGAGQNVRVKRGSRGSIKMQTKHTGESKGSGEEDVRDGSRMLSFFLRSFGGGCKETEDR